jgi:hypothetical protein
MVEGMQNPNYDSNQILFFNARDACGMILMTSEHHMFHFSIEGQRLINKTALPPLL